jgi:vacuolar-type H+-ATPase subunit E/Vma4
MTRIAFAGTDGRTLLWAWVVSTATSENYSNDYQGMVVRGTPAMPKFCEMTNWPVEFVTTQSNSPDDYAAAIIEALRVVPEPVHVQIAVSPKDYEYIETVKEDFFSSVQALKDVSVTPDPAIHPGGCHVRTKFGEVDATLESRLEAIRECLLTACGKKAESP